jgi:putative tryptophan/tyrosine transport system substrate-binding protein
MKRREFIMLLGSAAAWPIAAWAQQPAKLPTIGFISTRTSGDSAAVIAAFHQGLNQAGYSDRQDVAIEYRWAEGQYDRLPALAADLVRSKVSVIVAAGGDPAAQAAKAATATIPVVFVTGTDPLKAGLVSSFNRPSGNLTGVHVFLVGLGAKRLGLLHDLVPKASLIAVLANPNMPPAGSELRDVQEAAGSLGLKLHILRAGDEPEIDNAFATMMRERADALLVAADPFFTSQRDQIIELAARYAIPAIYELREYAAAGGLMSYGPSLTDGYRQVGVYAGKILKGAKPGDLPVVQPTKLDLVINLKTAKTLGFTIPPGVLAIADEVIE